MGLIALVLLCQPVAAQDPFRNLNFQRGQFQLPHRITKNTPVTNLPPEIKYSKEDVCLVPDLNAVDKNKVPVYLINPLERTWQIETMNLEVPIVLEVNLGNDHWERAESPTTYGFVKTRKKDYISSKHFRYKKARFWSVGRKATLRYSLYQKGSPVISSEPFQGHLPIGEVDKARYDRMAAEQTPPPMRIRYQQESTTIEEISDSWFDQITLLRAYGPCYYDLNEIQKWTSFVHQSPVSTRAERNLAVRLQMELFEPWPMKYSLDRLHDFCQTSLTSATTKGSGLRPLCWKVLSDFAETQSEIKHPNLAREAWNRIVGDFPTNEKEAATDFLCVDFIAKNFSPILDFQNHTTLLQDSNPYVRIVASNWLMGRSKPQQVLDYYTENHDRVDVYELVKILQFHRIAKPYSAPNWKLWEKALAKNIDYTFPELSLMFESDERKTQMRKITKASELSRDIRLTLEGYHKSLPNSPRAAAVRRLLDNVEARPNRFKASSSVFF